MSGPLRPEDRDALERDIRKTVAGIVIRRLELISRDSEREALAQTRLFVAPLALIVPAFAVLLLFLLRGN